MIGILASQVVLLVARNAVGGHEREITLLLVLMTTLTVYQRMLTHQRKLRVGMNFLDIKNFPAAETMAALAVVSHFGLVHVLVTGKAVGFNF